jgi:hypothetical protein
LRGDDESLIELFVDSEDIDDVDASDLDEDLDEGFEPADDDEQESTSLSLDDDPDEEEDSIASALAPGAPLVLLQRSHQHSTYLPTAISDGMQRHGARISVGVVAPLPRMTPENIRRFFSKVHNVPVRIADPEAFARLDSFGETLSVQRGGKPYIGPSTSKHWSYITDSLPQGGTSAWVAQVVEAQRNVGASVILTPGVWADPADSARSLNTIRQHAQWTHEACNKSDKVIVNITVPSSWLSTPSLRDRLLDELIDMDDNTFYLRVRWPLLVQPYGQVLDTKILDGYAEICNVLDENDKSLILPNTGITGWVTLAWGAHGFSTGVGTGERAFADTRVIRIKNRPRREPTRRTFVTPILHVTDVPAANRFNALPEVGECRCKFCRALETLPAGQFNKDFAGGQYLKSALDLTAEITKRARGRRMAARQIVRDARNLIEAVQDRVPLVDNNNPRHLQLWSDRLR